MKRTLGKRIKDFFIGAIWGNRFYHALLKPFDRYLVDVRKASEFDSGRIGLNKLCRRSDRENPLWQKGFDDLLFPRQPELFHRKVWEFCQALYGLRRLRRLSPQAVGLGVGCGHEEIMYFLANRVQMVYATDIYDKRYLGGEAEPDVLIHPDKYAPFRYRSEHLKVLLMDARKLTFEEESFDFVFCLSSLEHLGGRKHKLAALQEMYRVLKPNGVAVLTTELILNRLGRGRGYFRLRELLGLIREANFLLEEPLDLAVEEDFAFPPLALPMEVQRTPHLILRNFRTIYTSLSLFLKKPGDPQSGRSALSGDEVEIPTRPLDYRARIEVLEYPERVRADQGFILRVRIGNAGDTVWYRNSSLSHMVRVGVVIRDADAKIVDLGLPHFELPRDIRPGERAEVEAAIPPLYRIGSFAIHIDLVQELRFWFKDRGSEEKVLGLEVA